MSESHQANTTTTPTPPNSNSEPSKEPETEWQPGNAIKGYYVLEFCHKEKHGLLLDKLENLGAQEIKYWSGERSLGYQDQSEGFTFSYTYADHTNYFSNALNTLREATMMGDHVSWLLNCGEIDTIWGKDGIQSCTIYPIHGSDVVEIYEAFTPARRVFKNTPKWRAGGKDRVVVREAEKEVRKEAYMAGVKERIKARVVKAKVQLAAAQARLDACGGEGNE